MQGLLGGEGVLDLNRMFFVSENEFDYQIYKKSKTTKNFGNIRVLDCMPSIREKAEME